MDLTGYSNPAANTINIDTGSPGNLAILNLNGQPLFAFRIMKPCNAIDLSKLSSGIYLITFIDHKNAQMGKFIKL
jgi:hypothetical protein